MAAMTTGAWNSEGRSTSVLQEYARRNHASCLKIDDALNLLIFVSPAFLGQGQPNKKLLFIS
jgi:hypothetical protein